MKEEYRDIPNYEGLYQVSNLGNVKGIKRNKLLKLNIGTTGYYRVMLYKNNKHKNYKVHQLVAMAFLGHIPCGYDIVCDHIDNNPLNNRVDNLQLINQRNNCSKRLNGTSQYIGVYWVKSNKNWRAMIRIKGKKKHLGVFDSEIEASKAYQKALLAL